MSKHTKEPWEYYENDHSFGLKMPQGNKTRFDATPYAVFGGFEPADRDSMKDNARRVVACVNACSGIPTDLLESAKDWEAAGMQTVESVMRQRDELRAQLCRTRNLIESGEQEAALTCLCDAIANAKP